MDINKKYSYEKATGRLKATLRNDLLFHYILQKSNSILKSLICSLKGLDPDDVMDVIVTNPIDYAAFTEKTIELDVRVIMNNSEILNIELQMYHDDDWEKRSLFYLCRSFNSIKKGDDYSLLKPTTLIAIMDEELFPDYPEFYSPFSLLHEEKHYHYSTKLRINVLYLNHIDLATEKDKANKLDYWARLFRSNTWEELKQLAGQDPLGEEVAEVMYESLIQSQEQTLFEAHQRYLYSQKAAVKGGFSQGLQQGIEQGKLKTLVSLCEKGLISTSDAAKELNVSEDVFKEMSENLDKAPV